MEKIEYCCNKMEEFIHLNPDDGDEQCIYYSEVFDEYGIRLLDDVSHICINYCPWCGKKLPESKGDIWFDELEKLGYENPYEDDIPEIYKTKEWREKSKTSKF